MTGNYVLGNCLTMHPLLYTYSPYILKLFVFVLTAGILLFHPYVCLEISEYL